MNLVTRCTDRGELITTKSDVPKDATFLRAVPNKRKLTGAGDRVHNNTKSDKCYVMTLRCKEVLNMHTEPKCMTGIDMRHHSSHTD